MGWVTLENGQHVEVNEDGTAKVGDKTIKLDKAKSSKSKANISFKLKDIISKGKDVKYLNKEDPIYHNYRRNEKETNEEIIFCAKNSEDSKHYGDIHQEFNAIDKNSKLDNGDALSLASEYYGKSKSEIHDEVYPKDIVNSAGAWDDIDFINHLYDNNYFNKNDAIITPDGAVVFDKKFMKRK